jgi:uncharacterized repeat protein (TIGR03803 family)
MRNKFLFFALTVLTVGNSVPTHGQTYKFSILYSFKNNGRDPDQPTSLILDSKGNLYGTSLFGGKFSQGAVFEISPKGVLTVLHDFNGTDGSGVLSLARDNRQGNLYGTTFVPGNAAGTIFKMVRGQTGTYKLSTLYSAPTAEPQTLTLDASGNVFGTDNGCTCIFEIPSGGQWRNIYETGGQPIFPVGNLLIEKSGIIYASIDVEEISAFGWILELGQNALLFQLPDPAAGSDFLRQDAAGNIYGLAFGDGADTFGSVFKFEPLTGVFTTIYSFTGGADGKNPRGSFSRDSGGNIYGTAGGGPAGGGLVFKITPQGKETVIHNLATHSSTSGW